MAQTYTRRWIKVAGNSTRIKRATPPYWRCEVEGEGDQFLLKSWLIVGQATVENNSQDTNPSAKGNEFFAWVAYYGDIAIDEDRNATITLQNPEDK